MALFKKVELNSGVEVNYWKLSNFHIDWNNKKIVIILQGFIDQNARNSDKACADMRYFTLESKEFEEFISKNELLSRNRIYDYIKSLPDWNSGVDI